MFAARAVLAAAILTLGASTALIAQDGDIRLRAARRDTIRAAATITSAFSISNGSPESAIVRLRIDAPADWTVLMGADSVTPPPGGSALAMVSLAVPSRAGAGVYPVRVTLIDRSDRVVSTDSLMVLVPARRALMTAPLQRPGFVVSGNSYDATFVVRNRGNLPAEIHLGAQSSHSSVTIAETIVRLGAEESHEVRIHVATRQGVEAAVDDVIELTAAPSDDRDSVSTTSMRVTIVPEPSRSIEEFVRVPAQIRLRAASSDAVSPFEITGGGRVRDGDVVNADFVLRGPTGSFSPFGERDEYRLDVWSRDWRARFGDQFFMPTPLTAAAQPGFGVGVDGSRGILNGGVYGQQFRRSPAKGNEIGGFIGVTPATDSRLALNIVNRAGADSPGRIGSLSGGIRRYGVNADAELATSDATTGSGTARSLRINAATAEYSFDAGHLSADTGFASSQRGGQHNYVTATSNHLDQLSFGASGSRHRTDLTRSIGVSYVERFDLASVSSTLLDRYTLQLASAWRGIAVAGVSQSGHQHGARARIDQDVRIGLVSLEGEFGNAFDALGARRTYSDFSITTRHAMRGGSIGIWGERYSGGAITKGTDGTLTFGGDASVRASKTLQLSLQGFATRSDVVGQEWHTQADVLLSHQLRNGRSVSLRARLLGGGAIPSSDRSVAYLEYAMPMRLPVSRLRTPGRVYGRVIDAASGRGVAGALVRLGPQLAITDKEGQVAFGGVPGGEHRVSMSQETSFADAVFVGDPTLVVDSTRTQPTTFNLAIARAARIDVAVSRYSVVRTGMAGAADSLAAVGPLSNAMLMLTAGRDTVYRTTGEDGRASFADVPPGTWVVTIRGDAPAYHRFDPDRLEITLGSGETRTLGFRLLPRRREVQVIGSGEELQPQVAEPKPTPGTRATKIAKPKG